MDTTTKRRSRSDSRRTTTGSGPRHRGGNRGTSFGRRRGGNTTPRRGRGTKKIATFDPSQFINTNPVEVKEEVYTPTHTFGDFGLHPKIATIVENLGITKPSPIQDQVIPEIMKGHDVIGLAETGTGKTAAFLLPLIEKTLKDRKRTTLILTPTRELAIQIKQELDKLSVGFGFQSVTVVGGMPINPQIRSLHRKNHFIIGTPGRVLDLINRKEIRTQAITTVVLDEADRMLDMGFIHDMRKILATTPQNRETLLFSATMNKETEGLSKDFLRNPVSVSVKKKEVTNSIEQDIVVFNDENKFSTLTTMLKNDDFKRVIIFGAMKHSVERLSKQLVRSGISAESIHGNKTHGQRQKALLRFKKGSAEVLVATDVAARGIHVDNVSHVINYDLPNTFEDYVHRIGRTGRGTKRGKALTFVPKKLTR